MRPAALTASFYPKGETMKRNYQSETTYFINNQDLIKQIAFHEAGHAAAIYLYNKQNQLPPVFFQITVKSPDRLKDTPLNESDLFVAAVEGGRLIQSLPIGLIESTHYFSVTEQNSYQSAFEADMINLLVGPLAEAKHVALRDNEQFNAQLINVNTLHFYGGSSDLEKVYEYLEILFTTKDAQAVKLLELHNKAFQFISSPSHWRAIEHLAGYILKNKEKIISCEEAITVMDNCKILQSPYRL
jgi:hypothetical protein